MHVDFSLVDPTPEVIFKGPLIAQRLHAAFVPVRKAGKLPGNVLNIAYEKEYGTVSIHEL
jgi:adenine/guanine phosphoribosyltransferase-like PRPP-binding protein